MNRALRSRTARRAGVEGWLAAIAAACGLTAGCAAPASIAPQPAPGLTAVSARASAGTRREPAPSTRTLWAVRQPRGRAVAAPPISAAEAVEAAAEARMVSATFAFLGDQGGSRLLRTEHPLWAYRRPGDQSLADLIQRRSVHAVLLELLDERSKLLARLVIRLTYSDEDRPLALEAFDGLAFRRKLAAAGARIGSASELRVFLDATECPPYCTDGPLSPVPPELGEVPLGEVWCTGRISASCDATVFVVIEP